MQLPFKFSSAPPCSLCPCLTTGASEHDLLSRIVETLGPPPEWMMTSAKRTEHFFRQVPAASAAAGPGSSASNAASGSSPASSGLGPLGGGSTGAAGLGAMAAGGPQGHSYVLYTKGEFEAVNKCKVRQDAAGYAVLCGWYPLRGFAMLIGLTLGVASDGQRWH